MSWATLGGAPVVRARLLVPRSGVWMGDLTVDTDTVPKGALSLTLGDGAATWKATVLRAASAFGRTSTRIVGGAGGLAKALPGKSYRNTSCRVVLGDILAGAGERISPTVAPALLAVQLGAWSRAAGPASVQLGRLLATVAPGAGWRILPDGSLWLGAETWPASPFTDYEILSQVPTEGRWLLGATAGYQIAPGTTLEGGRVSLVEHEIDASQARTRVWFEAP